MSIKLTPATEQTIISLGLAFDGYTYARNTLITHYEGVHEILSRRMTEVQDTCRLLVNDSDNFAVNNYLHRNYQNMGGMPELHSVQWYTMLFFYLHLYRIPVPEAYRYASYDEWAQRPAGAAEAAAREIRQVLSRRG